MKKRIAVILVVLLVCAACVLLSFVTGKDASPPSTDNTTNTTEKTTFETETNADGGNTTNSVVDEVLKTDVDNVSTTTSVTDKVEQTDTDTVSTTDSVANETVKTNADNISTTVAAPDDVKQTNADSISTTSNAQGSTTQKDSTPTDAVSTVNRFEVVFKGFDGNVLKREEVERGKDATPPDAPKRDGFIFEKWSVSYEKVETDIVTTAVYSEINKPTLALETVSRSDTELVVKVSVYKNPGLLALVINNTYDSKVVSLEKFENGSVMSHYTLTPPKNMKSGCNFAWNINDVPENVKDGEVITLHYKIKKPITTSSPPISITCYDGAFDENYNLVNFEIINM